MSNAPLPPSRARRRSEATRFHHASERRGGVGLIPRACSDRVGDTVRHEMGIVAAGHARVGVRSLACAFTFRSVVSQFVEAGRTIFTSCKYATPFSTK
jgi:hypothetical protein